MKLVTFDDLVRLPTVQYYQSAFRKATGASLWIVPPDDLERPACFKASEETFCSLLANMPGACQGCSQTQARVRQAVARKRAVHRIYCWAGLTVVGVPVMVGGQHVASLLSGQVFRREPTERDFLLVARMLGNGRSADWLRKARRTYFATPVITEDRFQAILQLLSVFAQYLGDFASKQAVASLESEPVPVATAKEFVRAHSEEAITLEQVIQHVHVSRFYFCKLFKKATGMTLTEYVCRVRVEKAKTLLVDPSLRISEVVYAAGFGSIPRFNSVFRRYVGMPPTEYRDSLRTQLPAQFPVNGGGSVS